MDERRQVTDILTNLRMGRPDTPPTSAVLRGCTIRLVALGVMLFGIGACIHSCDKRYQRETRDARQRYEESSKELCITVQEEQVGATTMRVPRQVIGHDGWTNEAIYSPETQVPATSYVVKGLREDTHRPIALSVIDGGSYRKESIDALVSPGSRLCFPRGNIVPGGSYESHGFTSDADETYVTADTAFGTKRANRIRIE